MRPPSLSRAWRLARQVVSGCYNDGLIHAGNLAYMSLLAIFPFFLTGAAAIALVGDPAVRADALVAVLAALPPLVADELRPVALGVIEARSGWLLWAGGLIGLWTVGSLIETIRDILHRAYGIRQRHSIWRYRLMSTGIIIAAVLVLIASLLAQVLIGAVEQLVALHAPHLADILNRLSWSRIVAGAGLYGSIYLLFYSLTPAQFRHSRYAKWPGAILTTAWWIAVSVALPPVIRSLFIYDLTYGSLAGIMIVLFFFWLVGLGMVAGAELNAALARESKGAQVQEESG